MMLCSLDDVANPGNHKIGTVNHDGVTTVLRYNCLALGRQRKKAFL